MMHTTKPSPRLTVGIPTHVGTPSLIRVVESLLASVGVQEFRLIIAVDGNPLRPEIESRLMKLGAEIHFFPKRGGQVARLKDIISLAESELLVLTQDDVIFEADALRATLRVFREDPDIQMASTRVCLTPPTTLVERLVHVGDRIQDRIANAWRSRDNFLSTNGRCLALRTTWVKQFVLNERVLNSDVWFYLENRRRHGRYAYIRDAVVYIKPPLTMKEYFRQTKKFQHSRREMTACFPEANLTAEYRYPKWLATRAVIAEFFVHPMTTVLYIAIFLYTRLARNPFTRASGVWETDMSTKR